MLDVRGTTLATNALIERRGARTAFVTTDGFRDVIEMRTALQPPAEERRRLLQPDLVGRLVAPRARRCITASGLSALGGAKIRLVMADHQADPQKGRSQAEHFIVEDKVAGIVGTYHASVAATVSVTCERYRVPFVAGGA